MSRSTRSGAVYADENALGALMHNKSLKPSINALNPPLKSLVQAGNPQVKRAALGDISNRAVGQKDGIKKVSRIPVRIAPTVPQPVNPTVKQDDPMDTDDDIVIEQPINQSILQRKPAPITQQPVIPSLNQAVPLVSNFDILHARDAQYVTPYVNEIVNHWFSIETGKQANKRYSFSQTTPNPAVNSTVLVQRDLSARMREILIDWLIEVCGKFRLSSETLYLSIYLLDSYLSKCECRRTVLQLVGCAALLLAAKYEEIFAPECNDFVTISDNSFTKQDLLNMEASMLNALKFSLTTVSPLRFLQRFQQCLSDAIDVEGLVNQMNQPNNQLNTVNVAFTITQCSEFLLELTLQDYRFVHYLPSMMAASSLYLSCWLHSGAAGIQAWKQQSAHFQYTEGDIINCVKDICASANNQSKYRAVRKKYSDVKYGRVGMIEVVQPWA